MSFVADPLYTGLATHVTALRISNVAIRVFATDDCNTNRETQIVKNALKMILPVTLFMTMIMIQSTNGIRHYHPQMP